MINKMMFKYITNWIFISIILFLIVYFTFYVLVINRKKKNKIFKYFSMIVLLFLSFVFGSFSEYRTYRYYKIEDKKITIYRFLTRAYQDYKDEEIEIIYSKNVKFERHSKRPRGKNNRRPASKAKVYYLNIDNGKYRIPIDKEKVKNIILDESQQYKIYLYKNTKLVKDIFIVQK